MAETPAGYWIVTRRLNTGGLIYDLYTADDETGEPVLIRADYRRRGFALRRIERERRKHGNSLAQS